MHIKTAVAICAILIATVFGALSVALTATTDLLDLQSRQLARAGESIRVAQSIKNRLLAHNRNAFLYQANIDPARFESLETLREEIATLLLEAEALINNDEEEVVVSEVMAVTGRYLARLDSLQGEAYSVEEKYNLASAEADAAIAVVDRLTAVNRDQMDDLLAGIRQQNRLANLIAGILFVVGALILTGVAFAVFRFITRPLTMLAQTLQLYAKNGVATRVEPRGVSEIRTLGANFNSLTARLEEKRKDQLRFIAAIAHDLRNPLSSMSITTELLLGRQPDETRRMVELLFRQVKILDRLVGDLLDTTHIESGHLELKLASHDIRELVADAVELQRTGADLHNFRLELAEHLVCVCDGARICQVVNNLLVNAIKYSPSGGIITVCAWRDGAWAGISVTDQGIGIEPEDLENIFTPFNRAKATKGTIPGIGLGLSTSRRILEAHGGTLEVSSELGSGATFRIRLPLEPACSLQSSRLPSPA